MKTGEVVENKWWLFKVVVVVVVRCIEGVQMMAYHRLDPRTQDAYAS